MRADRSYTPDCPTNFAGAHCTPTAEPAVKFELRGSDTLNEAGIAVLNHNDVFLGWIKKEDIHKLPVDKISELDGIILTVELFIWAAGGG
jgi:hypothetical protein